MVVEEIVFFARGQGWGGRNEAVDHAFRGSGIVVL